MFCGCSPAATNQFKVSLLYLRSNGRRSQQTTAEIISTAG